MTECSICYDEITVKTGQVTLACSHVYHFGCVSRWFAKNETCPLCRSELCDQERIQYDEEEEEEEEYDDERMTWHSLQPIHLNLEIPDFNREAADLRAQEEALWVMRTTFEAVEEGVLTIPEPALPKMNLAWRVCETTHLDAATSKTTKYLDITEEEDTEYNRRWRHGRCNRRLIETSRGGYESA